MIMLFMMAEGGEKTEKATPKKRRDARKKGQVVKSQELCSAVMLLSIFTLFKIFGTYFGDKILQIFVELYSSIGVSADGFTLDYIYSYFIKVIVSILMVLAPLFVVAIIVGLVINYMQVGFLIVKENRIQFSRINPLAGLKRMFSIKSAVNLLKSIIKVIIIGYVAYGALKDEAQDIPFLMTVGIENAILVIFDITIDLALKIGLYLIFYSIFDYFYQWWEYEKSLRMTKQEVKEEYKLLEGNPAIKGEIKRKQREIGMRRMMQAVPEADVVITNPTHYAIALKYDAEKYGAPTVIAKGKDRVAQRIKEIAKEHKIEIVENKLLAQTLYKTTDVGKEIPVDLYKAVAEILAQVYRLKRR